MTHPHLPRFLQAQETVYGPLTTLPNPTTWHPPARSDGHRGRYLWTDAFGVLNFLTLARETANPAYLTLAQRLVHTVHDVLGRDRAGSARLPGATDAEPLAGGLRIGKEDDEGPDADGQYHHYLTLWMFALNRLTHATADPRWNDLAVQLAKAVHPAFFVGRGTAAARMVWKVKMDLSAPLVESQGNLDPAEGYVTYRQLEVTKGAAVLEDEVRDYWGLVERKLPLRVSPDALDLGMGMWLSSRCGEAWAREFGEKGVKYASE